MLKALIVGDIRLYRDGLAQVLRVDDRVEVLGTSSDSREGFDHAVALEPDVVLVDRAMKGSLALARRIRDAAIQTRVVALTVSEVESEVIACAEAGVAGYVTREASLDELLRVIQAAKNGELRCSSRAAGTLLRRVSTLADETLASSTSCLTGREKEVLERIERGLSNKEIASALGIETATVKNHVHHILEKLHVHSRGEAAAVARRSLGFAWPRRRAAEH